MYSCKLQQVPSLLSICSLITLNYGQIILSLVKAFYSLLSCAIIQSLHGSNSYLTIFIGGMNLGIGAPLQLAGHVAAGLMRGLLLLC